MSGFQDIVGHKQIIEHLKNAKKLNKVSHAYIFSGEKGSGKKLLASRFAELLQCEGEGEKPCGKAVPAGRRRAETTRILSGSPTKNRTPSAWTISGSSW